MSTGSPAHPYRADARASWRCPRCDAGLVGTAVAGVRLDGCTRCHGHFVGHDLLATVTGAAATIDALRAALPREPSRWAEGGRVYVACPLCGVLMNRRQYATGAHIVVDACKPHGVWFDGGELAAALDFVADGGLARAARRDAERAREAQRRDEQQREQLRQAGVTAPPPPGSTGERGLAAWIEAMLWTKP